MIQLDKAMYAWGKPAFKAVLKQEIERIDAAQLPLLQGLTTGSYPLENQFSVMINSVSEAESLILVTAGIFYQSVIAGCACADDPTPINENNEYCEVRLEIDKASGATLVELVRD